MEEARERGLLNLKTTVDALPYLVKEKNIELFTRNKIYTEAELESRYEILLEKYCKTLNIEALTMLDIVKKDILPASLSYTEALTDSALKKKQLGKSFNCDVEEELVSKLSTLAGCLYSRTNRLENELLAARNYAESKAQANYYRDIIFVSMQEVRAIADELEGLVAKKYWPLPSYGDLLFSVK